MRRDKYVSASEVGNCKYCAYQLYLRTKHGDSLETIGKFKVGDKAHDKFNAKHRTTSLSGPVIMIVLLLVLWVVAREYLL